MQALAEALGPVLEDEQATTRLASLARPCVWLQTKLDESVTALGSTRRLARFACRRGLACAPCISRCGAARPIPTSQ